MPEGHGTASTPRQSTPQRRRQCPIRRLVGDRAFTLIEVLVTISVIAVLISIALPTLKNARGVARQTREMIGAQQLMVAFNCFAGDNKGAVLTGLPSAAAVNASMLVTDDKGRRLLAPAAQRYPWRIAPYFTTGIVALYDNQKLMTDLRDAGDRYEKLGFSYPYFFSLFPALGMNVAFVGGSVDHGMDPLSEKTFGRRYVSRIDEPRRPSRLLTFVSARPSPAWSFPDIGTFEGYFLVEAPYSSRRKWAAAYNEKDANSSGFVALRHNKKAISAMFDGHVETLGFAELDDMTRWSDKATDPAWYLGKK
jgi:prepilin-type N-terminal cleavage/methylation domain-containing protein/prepilin-type processing-associated H-X9-DG protein